MFEGFVLGYYGKVGPAYGRCDSVGFDSFVDMFFASLPYVLTLFHYTCFLQIIGHDRDSELVPLDLIDFGVVILDVGFLVP